MASWQRWLLFGVGVLALGLPGPLLLLDAEGRGLWADFGRDLDAAAGRDDLGLWARSHEVAEVLHRHDDALRRRFPLVQPLKPHWQHLLLRLGMGNETVYLGRDHFMELRVAVDAVLGPGFLEPVAVRPGAAVDPRHADPRTALLGLAAQLRERGIALWLLPLPSKVTIHPEGFDAGVAPPVHNASYAELCRQLEAAGIVVVDPAPTLVAMRAAGEPTYLRTDSHWHPAAVEAVAAELARRLQAEVALAPPSRTYRAQRQRVAGRGDLVRLLELGALWPTEPVDVTVVSDEQGAPFRPDAAAEILLLGDSFTNVFADESLGWGQSAGLAEQLAHALRRPVDRLAVNGGGALGSRQRLREELAGGRDRLAGKKVVVLQFAARDLSVGDWRP
jgi:hypothetical protein